MVRSGHQMREYLLVRINAMLRRIQMFGGEPALWAIFDHLFYLDDEDRGIEDLRQSWRDRNVFTPIGPKGALQRLLPESVVADALASLYAETARNRGWLRPDRILTRAEYSALRATLEPFAAEDRAYGDVVAEFGAPSVRFGGGSPSHSTTFGYATDDLADPMVFFHLWDGVEPGSGTWPPPRPEAVLLAVRYGLGRFPSAFVFTPTGTRLRPTADESAPLESPSGNARPGAPTTT